MAGIKRQPGHTPPFNLELETALLCCCLIDGRSMAGVNRVQPAMFYDHRNAAIFRACQALYLKGQDVNILTVSDELRAAGRLEMVGGDGYIMGLTALETPYSHVATFATRVIAYAASRNLFNAATQIVQEAADSGAKAQELQAFLSEQLTKVQDMLATGRETNLGELLPNIITEIAAARDGQKLSLIPTGFPRFDRMSGGKGLGDFDVLAADPSMGKSDIMINQALNISRSHCVGIISAEMDESKLGMRILGNLAGVDSMAMRAGRVNDDEFQELMLAGDRIPRRLHLEFVSSPSPYDIRAMVDKWVRRYGVQVVYVDNLTELKRRSHKEQFAAFEEAVKVLRDIPRDYKINLTVLQHLNQDDTTGGKPKRPTLNKIRYGMKGAQPDCVDMLFRENYQKPDIKSDVIELLRRKGRGTGLGRFDCDYDLVTGRIREMVHNIDQSQDDDKF
jgi:replicative DNA helicase